jgi:MerR family transcriptional regulator/heat shock protein HspR
MPASSAATEMMKTGAASGRSRGGRRYSARDVALLREVQRLSQDEGVNLAGIKRIIELEAAVDVLHARISELSRELDRAHAELARRQAPSTSLVVWQPQRRRR